MGFAKHLTAANISYAVLALAAMIPWRKGNKKLKVTQEYQDYQNYRKK